MRWTKVWALSASAALALAACSGGDAKSPNSGTGGETAAAASARLDPTAKGPAPIPAGAQRGGTARLAFNNVPETLDPTRAYYRDASAILSQLVVRSLTTWKVEGGESILVPDLATDLGRQSEDGLTWTFTLKDNITYSDGTPIKAADFVYATKRSFAFEELPNGPTYNTEYFKGGRTYKGPFADKSAFPGAEATDDKTVVFHLTKRWETFPYYTSFSQMSPIPQDRDTQGSYGENPLASGPYMFDTYRKSRSLKLKKNENWDASTDPARRQLVDAFDFTFGAEVVATQQGILTGNGDDASTLNTDPLDSSLVNRVTTQAPKQLVTGADPCVTFFNLDTRKIPLDVRRAIALAYPYDPVRRAGGDSSLSYSPATSYMAPQVPGFTQHDPVNGMKGVGGGDPAAAKALLDKAGKLGFDLSYYYINDDRQQTQINAALRQRLEAAGFQVRDIGVSKNDIRKKRSQTDGRIANTWTGPTGWCYDWPSGDSVYPPIFSSAAASSGQSVGFLSDVALDKEMERISALPVTEQGPQWSQFDEKLARDYLPSVPISYGKANYLFGTKVHNVVNDPNRGWPDMAQLWIG